MKDGVNSPFSRCLLPTKLLRQKFKPTHECGVFAIFGHPEAANITYYGLFALQHRGQESAGIVSAKGTESPFTVHKGMGLVSQVFSPDSLERLSGTRAIGHVRYSTTGSSTIKNAQPFVVDTGRGQIAVGHNGNLVNAAQLREELEAKGSIFQTTVDSEIILHLLAQPRGSGGVLSALRRIEGAFSIVLMGVAPNLFLRPMGPSIGRLLDHVRQGTPVQIQVNER